jgi:hypothetical protein
MHKGQVGQVEVVKALLFKHFVVQVQVVVYMTNIITIYGRNCFRKISVPRFNLANTTLFEAHVNSLVLQTIDKNFLQNLCNLLI